MSEQSQIVRDLVVLAELHRDGTLSDDEFAAAKAAVLTSPASAPTTAADLAEVEMASHDTEVDGPAVTWAVDPAVRRALDTFVLSARGTVAGWFVDNSRFVDGFVESFTHGKYAEAGLRTTSSRSEADRLAADGAPVLLVTDTLDDAAGMDLVLEANDRTAAAFGVRDDPPRNELEAARQRSAHEDFAARTTDFGYFAVKIRKGRALSSAG